MLPSDLLRAKISGGKIRPLYVNPDPGTLALAERITGIFSDCTGKRKGELLERLREVEDEGYDFKLVRGLSALLERRCVFEAESVLNPREARMAVFEEASKARATTLEERSDVLRRISTKLRVAPEALEMTLFSDLEDRLILKEFERLGPELLLKSYNLSLTQTLLFKSLRVEFSASGNWKNIFREVKRLGLIYLVEKDEGGGYRVTLDGPLSLFKMTERYGTSIAKLLPQITSSESWTVKAEILARSMGGRVYAFEADSKELGSILATTKEADGSENRTSLYDSTVEQRFARSFNSYGSGWTLRREPEPLLAGTHVLIPDFGFEKHGVKVYLEVVGFWTPEYLERKISKLSSIAGVDMIIAADESLACSKLERLKSRALVIYYRKDVPLKPIIDHLKEREASVLTGQAEEFRRDAVTLNGDVVSLDEIAGARGASVETVRVALQHFEPEGYSRVGNLFISKRRLDEIGGRLAGVEKLTDALRIIVASGVKEEDGQKVLDALGYTSVWEGMEIDKVRISKSAAKADNKTA
ncbi:MAG: DUF790 family protein [Nitrososphaerales archaeon]|jgi:predicted nuclease of restriction endonuclease-like RecB superfamily